MNQDRRLRAGEHPARQIFLAWCAVSAILLLTGLSRILTGEFPDPDDMLRLVQVRDLLAGQGWFDPTQYRIDPPAGTSMHWSRLVDIPLLAVIAGFRPFVGQATAETIALIAVPLLTFGVAIAAIGRLAWRLLGLKVAVFAVLACGFLPALLFQYQPMRIDHHGWQIASVAVALWAISWRDAKGGWLAGLAMAFGLSISLEILPMAGAFGGVLFLRWWFDYQERDWLVSYMLALSLGLAGFYLATRGPSPLEYCDAVSPAHLAFFLVAALGTLVIARATRLRGFGLVVLFGLVGALALGAFALASPKCLTTPFAALDPVVERYWYVQVLEGQPLWREDLAVVIPAVIQMLAAIGATLALRMRALDWVRRWWSDYLLLLLAAFALSLFVSRSLALASIIAAIPLGWLAATLLDRIRREKAPVGKLGAMIAFLVLLAPVTLVTLAGKLVPADRAGPANTASVGESKCVIREQALLLDKLPRGTVFAPLDIGPSILLKSHHGVVATGHHRANEAMADVIEAFIGSPEAARERVEAHGADYVALCTDLSEVQLYAADKPGSLADMLVHGGTPDWLEPVDISSNATFRVLRVKRQAGTKSIATPLMQ